MSNKTDSSRKIILTNDEFFIIMGLVVLNIKNFNKIIEPFKEYNREKYNHKITFSEEVIDDILHVCNIHKNQKDMTFKTFNKIKMTKDLMIADNEYEKKIEKINETYKNLIHTVE